MNVFLFLVFIYYSFTKKKKNLSAMNLLGGFKQCKKQQIERIYVKYQNNLINKIRSAIFNQNTNTE